MMGPAATGHTSRLDEVSVYRGVDPAVIADGTWQQAIEVIRSDRYKAAIKSVRAISDKKSVEYRKTKMRLPGVTFGGTFNGIRSKKSVQFPTGLITADVDHLSDVKKTFANLVNDEHVWFAFVSPGGDGIKCGFRSETVSCDDDHKQFYSVIETYFNKVYGIKIDTACKDISRLTFMSYDPEAYINENACYFDHSEFETPQPEPRAHTTTDINPRKQRYGHKVLAGACGKIRQSQPGDQHHIRVEQATLVGGFIPTGYIDRGYALNELERAVGDSAVKNMAASMKDITDGIAYGETRPLDPISVSRYREQNDSNGASKHEKKRAKISFN